jgi:GT2 family glycosyltransferase
MIDLTVAIVSYNSARAISTGLSDVLRTDKFSVVVVDNNSTDGSAEFLENEYPLVEVIKLESNQGYGCAANVVLRVAKSNYVLLLNPDIEVSDDDIVAFFNCAQQAGRGAVVYAPATKAEEFTKTGWHDVSFVLGAAMLFDVQRLTPFGLFDERFFLFYEEKDLCYRIVFGGGVISRLSDVLFGHSKGTSSGASLAITYLKQWHVGWSSAYFRSKHQLNRGRFRLSVLFFSYSFKRFFSTSLEKRLKYKARCGGLLSYFLGREAFNDLGQPRRIELLTELKQF